MRKQRKVSVRMRFTLYFLGVKESHFVYRGPFLERPGKLTGPVSYFEIKVSRKVGCVLTLNEGFFFPIV